jgi:hypothetical protein
MPEKQWLIAANVGEVRTPNSWREGKQGKERK